MLRRGLAPNFRGVGVPLSNVELIFFLDGVGPSRGPNLCFFDDASA